MWFKTLNAKSADSLFEQTGERLTDGQRERGMNRNLAPLWSRGLTDLPTMHMLLLQQRSGRCEGNTIKIRLFV